jgi:hypothetical protein
MPAPRLPQPNPRSPIEPCRHTRVQVVARQQGHEYFECLDCRTILEPDDLDSGGVEEPGDSLD